MDIKQDGWDDFIKKAFANPESFIDVHRIQKKGKKGGIQNKLRQIVSEKK